jgi:hypothetical protein
MARGRRMNCGHNGENAGTTNVNPQPPAHARMISFQLQSPVSQCSNNSPVAYPSPTLNATFPGVPPRQATRREPLSTLARMHGQEGVAESFRADENRR